MIEILALVTIIFTASATHRLFGFGFASIALPLINVLTELNAGVLLMLGLSSFIAAQNLVVHRKNVDSPQAMRFVFAGLIGVGLGYLVVDSISVRGASILASSFILAIAVVSLITKKKSFRPPLVPIAIAAGVSNVISAVNGPLIGLFFGNLKSKKEAYIGTVSFVFLAVNLLAIAAQLGTSPEGGLTLSQSASAFGAMLAGSYAGKLLFSRIDMMSYKSYLLWVIIGLSVVGIVSAAVS